MEGGKLLGFGIFVSLVLSASGGDDQAKGLAPCNFPAIYNFGDSNSDTGGWAATINPQTPPVGQTFFGKPAGRSCDGRLVIDFLAEELKLPYLSAYLDSIGSNFSHGVNFAVGAATIRRQNFTPPHPRPFDLGIQSTQFNQLKARTIDLSNQGKNTSRLPKTEGFSKALYTLDIGQNDVRGSLFGINQSVIPDMINQLVAAVQSLYAQGARAFWVHNVGQVGCLPGAQNNIWNRSAETFDQNGCINRFNQRTIDFNNQLKDRVIKLRAELNDSAITYVDVYAAKYRVISNAKNLGFVDPLKYCMRGINGTNCENPSAYISWDGEHFTEAANNMVAKSILNGSLSDPPLPITLACHKVVVSM